MKKVALVVLSILLLCGAIVVFLNREPLPPATEKISLEPGAKPVVPTDNMDNNETVIIATIKIKRGGN